MYHVPPDPHGNDPSMRAWLRDLSFISGIGIILMFGLLLGLVAYSSGSYAVLAGVSPLLGASVFFVRSYARRKKADQSLRAIWLAAFITASALIFCCAIVFYISD